MRAALPVHGRDQLRDKPNCEPPLRLSLGSEQNGRPIWSKQRHPIRPEACLLLTDGESPVALAIFGFGLGRCIAVHGLESAMGVGGGQWHVHLAADNPMRRRGRPENACQRPS
jgi:hypothetical protein